jgi:hypothetical protein
MMSEQPITKEETKELAHELLWENLVNSGRTGLLNLSPIHIAYMTLLYSMDLCMDIAPDEEEAKRMIENVLEDVLKKEKD